MTNRSRLSTLALCTLLLLSLATPAAAGDTPAWKTEFERLCSQTATAASLPAEEVEQLIEDSRELLETLHGVDDPGVKIYIFRLEKCLSFFEYARELQNRD